MRRPPDFNQAPLLTIWEVTRACALACQHCRASAEDWRDPRELSLDQGKALIDDIAGMGTPLIVFTGGDPLQRDDLEDLVRHSVSRGLTVGAIPAATPRLTRDRVFSLRDAGVHQMALSLDGETAEKHDAFRMVEGTFAKVMEGAKWIHEAGVPLQINSVFGEWNFNDFDAMAEMVTSLNIVFWEVFFLVPVGRGTALKGCTPEQVEILFGKLHELAKKSRFIVKVTEGQHFRRYVRQHGGMDMAVNPMNRASHAAPKPVNAGHGFCFVDHTGEVCPSGFLPIQCGNVKERPLSDIYRNHPTFRQLRDFTQLKGKCGVCEFRDMCSGGSRARAYAVTGDIMGAEPACAYEPAAATVR